jgi:hypothetical protein
LTVSFFCQYMLYVATSVVLIGELVTALTGFTHRLEPLWWLIFFVGNMATQVRAMMMMVMMMMIGDGDDGDCRCWAGGPSGP